MADDACETGHTTPTGDQVNPNWRLLAMVKPPRPISGMNAEELQRLAGRLFDASAEAKECAVRPARDVE